MVTYILAIVAIAFLFDFINGFHDSANSIATIVGTRVLSPFAAVVWAAVFNFSALFDGTPNALDVIKWKELYDKLEEAMDECEDVSNVLESISLKNS